MGRGGVEVNVVVRFERRILVGVGRWCLMWVW